MFLHGQHVFSYDEDPVLFLSEELTASNGIRIIFLIYSLSGLSPHSFYTSMIGLYAIPCLAAADLSIYVLDHLDELDDVAVSNSSYLSAIF